MMPPLVLTTRPRDDAARDIDWLAKRGISAISAPMLEIKPLEPHFPDINDVEAVVLTSRHAARLLAGEKYAGQKLVELACFCVGETTAREAAKAGFTKITTGPGDGEGLKGVIIAAGVKSLYWPSAVDTGFNIAAALADDGITVIRQPIYKAAEVAAFPPEAEDALSRGDVAVVLAHSGRAGAHFTAMMIQKGLAAQLRSMVMIAISSRAAGLSGDDWHTITVVDQPRRKAMLKAAVVAIRQIDDEAQMTEKDKDLPWPLGENKFSWDEINAEASGGTNAKVVSGTDAETVGETDAGGVGETDTETVGESDAEVVGETDAEVAGETDAEVVGETDAEVAGETYDETVIDMDDNEPAKPASRASAGNRWPVELIGLGIAVMIALGLGYYIFFMHQPQDGDAAQIDTLTARIESLEGEIAAMAETNAGFATGQDLSELASRLGDDVNALGDDVNALSAAVGAFTERLAESTEDPLPLDPLIARIDNVEARIETLTIFLANMNMNVPPTSEATSGETQTGWTSFFSNLFRVSRTDNGQ